MTVKTVGVLGCGLMGAGVAQVSAAAGFKTIVREVNEDVLKKGLGRIEKFLTGGVEKGKVTAEQNATVLRNLSGTTTYADLKDCDLVIEAIVENVEIKKQAYAQVEAVVRAALPDCVEHLVALHHGACGRHEAARPVGGLHFFNPVPLMKLVEVYEGAHDERRNPRGASCLRQGHRQAADLGARSRPASSSTACWCRTCSTRSAAWKRGWAPWRTSTTG